MIAFVVIFVILWIIVAGFRWIIAHPILSLFIFGSLTAVAFIGDTPTFRYVNVPVAFTSASSARQHLGSPSECKNTMMEIICTYSESTLYTRGDRVEQIDWRGMRYKDFRLTEEFYRDVLGRLHLPYREPVVATLDEIIFQGDGWMVEIYSNDQLEVSAIRIHNTSPS